MYIYKYFHTHTDTCIYCVCSFIGHDSSLCVTHALVGHGGDSFISVSTCASAASRFVRGCKNVSQVFPDTELILLSLLSCHCFSDVALSLWPSPLPCLSYGTTRERERKRERERERARERERESERESERARARARARERQRKYVSICESAAISRKIEREGGAEEESERESKGWE